MYFAQSGSWTSLDATTSCWMCKYPQKVVEAANWLQLKSHKNKKIHKKFPHSKYFFIVSDHLKKIETTYQTKTNSHTSKNGSSIPLTTQRIRKLEPSHRCRSNYKMKCFCWGNPLNAEPNQCVETNGMRLRAVIQPTSGYIPFTGARWVHVLCDPGDWTEWIAYTTSWIKHSPLTPFPRKW